MSTPTPDPANRDLTGLIADLGRRDSLGRTLLTLSLAPELVASSIETAAGGWKDGKVSEVGVRYGEDSLALEARVKVKASIWPPRPSLDTRAAIALRSFTVRPDGSLGFTVEEPLEFSSGMAELLAKLLGNAISNVPLGSLRTKGEAVSVNTPALFAMLAPKLAGAERIQLFALRVSTAAITVEFGFSA